MTTITLDSPEWREALNDLNAYIAKELGYTYRPKRKWSSQEKWKRNFRWWHRQKELKRMNECLDFTIEPSVSEDSDVFGNKITLTLTDKATWEKTSETLNCVWAHNMMCKYKQQAYSKKRA